MKKENERNHKYRRTKYTRSTECARTSKHLLFLKQIPFGMSPLFGIVAVVVTKN